MALSPTDQRQILNFFVRSFSEDIALLSNLQSDDNALLPSPPLAIQDLNGEPLFLDFAIGDVNGKQVGIVRSSARGEELPLIDSIMIGPPLFDPSATAAAAIAQAPNDVPGATVVNMSFVCYGYPRIGVLVTCQASGPPWSLVYDAAAGVLVRKWQGAFAQPVAEAGLSRPVVDGVPFYSFLGRMRGDDAEAGLAAAPLVRATAAGQWSGLRAVSVAAAPRIAVRGSILPAGPIGQETQVYCAVATIKMMLEYVGIRGLTQDQIAAALQTNADGTTNSGIVAGVPVLTGNVWQAHIVSSPTFSQNVALVEALIPAKSAIPGHARLLRGWREYSFISTSGAVLHRAEFYIINDPYPLNTGQIVLESAVTPIQNFYVNSVFISQTGAATSTPPPPATLPASSSSTAEGAEAGPTSLPQAPVPPGRSASARAINSRTFEVTLPAGVRVTAGLPVPPEVLELAAASLRLRDRGSNRT